MKPLKSLFALVVSLFFAGFGHSWSQDCGLDLVDTLQVCSNFDGGIGWEELELDTVEWTGVEWTSPIGEADSVGTEGAMDWTSSGWWYFEFYSLEGDTCGDSTYVDFLPSPVPSFTAQDGQCADSPVVFNNSTVGGVGTVYSWDFGDGSAESLGVNPSHVYDALGPAIVNFQVTLTASNGDGSCPISTTGSVSVLQTPDIIFDATALCQSDSDWPNYTPVIVPNFSVENWHLDWGNGTDTTFSSVDFLNLPTGQYNSFGFFDLTLTADGVNGCSSSLVETLFVGTNPTIGAANPGNTDGICAPAFLTFPILEFESNVPGTTYSIDFGDGTEEYYDHPPPDEVSHWYVEHSCGDTTPEGSENAQRFKVVASNLCGTSTVTIDPIRLHQTPNLDILGPTFVCPGTYPYSLEDVGLVVSSTSCTESYLSWTISTMEGEGVGLINPTNTPDVQASFPNEGVYQITAAALHPFCGTDQDTIEVCVTPDPVAMATSSGTTGCAPYEVDFGATMQTLEYCGTFAHSWSVSGGDYTFTNGTSSLSESPSILFLEEGNYTVTQTVQVVGGTCYDSHSYSIDVDDVPSVSISGDNIACEGDEVLFSISGWDTGGAFLYDLEWEVQGETEPGWFWNPINVDVNHAGTWEVSATISNSCGSSTATSSIEVYAAPALTLDYAPYVCEGQTQTVQVSGGDSYNWTPDPISTNDADDFVQYPSGMDDSQVVDLTAVTEHGAIVCTTEVSVPLVVEPNPVLELPNIGTYCAEELLNPQPAVSEGTPGFTYDWVYGAEVAAGPDPEFLADTSASVVSLVVTDVNGCTAEADASVEVLPLPEVYAGELDGFCNQSIDTTLASGIPLGGIWSGDGISADGTLNPSNLGIGDWVVTYSYTDSNGCTNSDYLEVDVFAPEFADAGPDLSFCDVDTNVVFTGYFPDELGTWSGPGVLDADSGWFDLSNLTPGLHSFTFEYGTGTCATSDERVIEIFENPQPLLTAEDLSVCVGDLALVDLSGIGGAGGYEFFWSADPAWIFTNQTATTTTSSTSPITLAATVMDSNGCSGTDSLEIEVLELPVLTVLDTLVACNQAILEVLPSPSPSGGTWAGQGVVDPIGQFNPDLAGLDTIPLVYTYTDAEGCTNSIQTVAVVEAPVFADAGLGSIVCDVDTVVQLEGYSPADGTWTGPGMAADGTWNAGPLGPGVYEAVYSFGASSCWTESQVSLTVLSRPELEITGPLESCLGDSVSYMAIPSGGNGPYQIEWLVPEGVLGASVTLLPEVAGPFTVEALVTDASGCSEYATFTTTVHALPVVDAGADILLCAQPITEQLTGATPDGGTYSGTPAVSSDGVFSPDVSGVGNHEVIYTYMHPATGCTSSDTLVIEVVAPLFADAGPDLVVCLNGGEVALEAATAGDWSGATAEAELALIAPASMDPEVAGAGVHPFVLTYGAETCLTRDTMEVEVLALPVMAVVPESEFCANDTVGELPVATPLGGTWTGPGLVPGSDPVAFGTLVGEGVYDLAYSYTDPLTGCTNQIPHQVIINDPPNVFAGADLDLCNQPIVEQLTGAIPDGSFGNISAYYGLGAAAAAVTPDGQFDPSVTGPGTFDVVYAYTSPFSGCIGRDTLEVAITEPVVAEAGMDTVACFNAPPLVLAGFTPATGGTWFTQTPEDAPALVNATTGQILPQFLLPGDHQLFYSYGSGTCYTKDSLTVTIDPLPAIALGGDDFFCLNDTLMPLATATPEGGEWEGTGATGTDFNTLVGVGGYDLIYWYEDPVTGCADTADHYVTVHPLPAVDAGPDVTLCDQPIPEDLSGFSPPLTGPGGSGLFYGLGGAAGAVTSTGTFDPSLSGVGTFQVVYLYTSSITNCSERDTLEVTVVPPVVANAGLDTVVCANAPLLQLDGFFPLTGGAWSGVGAAAPAVVDAAAGTLNPQLLAPGTYAFALEVGTGTCYSSDALEVTIDALPDMGLGAADAFCLNDTLMPLATATPTGGTWEGPGVSGTNFETLIGADTYALIYWYEDPVTGCRDTLDHEVVVNPLPVVNAGTDVTLCDQPIVEQLQGFSPGFAEGGSGFFYGLGEAAVSATGVYEPSVSGVGTFEVVYEFTSATTGCSHTDTLEVVVNPPVVADAGLDSVVCANAPLLQLDGYVPTSNINWFSTAAGADAAVVSASGGVLNPQALPVGDHVFSIEYGAGTCYSRDSMVVTVLALPELTLGEANAWCGNDGVEVVSEALPVGGTWFGQGVVDEALGAFDTDQPAATYAPGYTYTDPVTGCADTAFHQVTIHPLPVADFQADDLGCTNADLPLTQSSTGAVSAFWWFGDGDISYAWEPAHTFEDAGFYTIELVVTTSLGCRDSLEQAVQITTPPTASASLTPIEGCAPLDVTFDNTSTAPFADFLWEIDGDLLTAFEPNAMTFQQGDTLLEIPVSLTVENLCATDVYQDTILVYPTPSLSFAMLQDTACSPFGLELLNTSVGMPDVLVWDLGNGDAYTGHQPPATWYTTVDDPADFTISLIGQNECGTDSVSSVFHLLPNTVSAFFDASELSGCAPLDVEFTDLSANTTEITFDFGNGLVSFDSVASTVYTGPGTYEVQQFVTNGCAFDTVGLSVEVFAEPEFSLVTNASSYCVGEPVNFTVQANASGAAEWAFGNGENGVGYFASTSYDEPGNYWAVAEVGTALFQCVGTDSVSVLVHPSPVWDLAVPEPGCSPFEAAFENASANAAFVTWSFGDGSSPGVSWAPVHEYVNTTGGPVTFEVSVHAESVNFCEADTTFEIGVLPAPVAAVQLGSAVSCEVPVELDLVNASTGGVASTWWVDGELVGAGSVPDVTVGEVGAHEVVLEVENAYGCVDADTAVFTVLAQPLAALDVFPVTGCQVLPVTFMNLSVGAVSTQLDLASPSGLIYSGPLDDEANIDLEEPGIYTAQFVATSVDGCTNALDVPQLIQVHPTPVADFESTPFIGTAMDIDPLNDTWTFESTSVGASIWNWNFGDGGVGSGEEVSHTFDGAGFFTVTLTAANEFGCTDQRQDVVALEQLLQVFVPNAFTPPSVQSQATGTGSRGLNDAFRPVFSDRDLVAEYEFTVINRWGDVVFHSFDPDESWVGDAVRDGSHYAEDDVYVWTLYYQPTYEDIGIRKQGHVTLIRD